MEFKFKFSRTTENLNSASNWKNQLPDLNDVLDHLLILTRVSI